jgi:hypothetical protein
MIQLTKNGLVGSPDSGPLLEEFKRSHAVRLPGLIHSDLVRLFATRLDQGGWSPREYQGVGRDLVSEDSTVLGALQMLSNNPVFVDFMRRATGLEGIKGFLGRIYRLMPGTNQFSDWHRDTLDGRMIGMSINLGLDPYRGGVFRLRESRSGCVLCELVNTGPGDAIVFRISDDLEHMVTTVEGDSPKTAFAGWFRPDEYAIVSMLRQGIDTDRDKHDHV